MGNLDWSWTQLDERSGDDDEMDTTIGWICLCVILLCCHGRKLSWEGWENVFQDVSQEMNHAHAEFMSYECMRDVPFTFFQVVCCHRPLLEHRCCHLSL
jgi:hypothetical protein